MNERPIAAGGSRWVSPAANLAAVLDQGQSFQFGQMNVGSNAESRHPTIDFRL